MPSHQIPVMDAMERPRLLGVRLSDDRKHVLLTPPPGEATSVRPEDVELLIEALQDVRAQAYDARRTGR